MAPSTTSTSPDRSTTSKDDAPACRKTKSWRELGFDIDEPPSVVPDALASFRAMPHADQLAVLGKDRLDLLDSGAIRWSDLATRRRPTAGGTRWCLPRSPIFAP
jgi:hypothetical protein